MYALSNTRTALYHAHKDYKQIAKSAKLQYVGNFNDGIIRKRKGKGFAYYYNGKIIIEPDTLARIKALVIPPAWTEVWICPKSNGHIQATGLDVRKRKQYKYHTEWSAVRNQTKYYRLYDFGKALPALRKKVETDICSASLSKKKFWLL